MRERKKTGVHGTLGMTLMAWKLNSKKLLCKTLNSRINIIDTRAVSNIIKKIQKMCSGVQTGTPRNNPKVSFSVIFNAEKVCI